MSSKKRWYEWSPSFEDGEHANASATVTVEQDKNGTPRWRITTPKGDLLLTATMAYNLGDALDRSLSWYEDMQDEEQLDVG